MHIHSCLSPCGDIDMTPNNIVNMSIIKGLDIIAVTDHNTCGNAESVMRVADGKIIVVPGMEIETSEDIHVVSYFKTLDDAKKVEKIIKSHLPKIKNKSEIYGNQYYMDENDEIVGEEENLLICASSLNIYQVFDIVKSCGGVPVPAHIDKSSYSVLSNLGFLPPDLNAKALEITPKNRYAREKEFKNYNIISNSDAHYLEDISEPEFFMEIEERSIEAVLKSMEK